ncbi:MAG TPA: hypothetical protein VG759_29235 [Candidatus Angelobacter sp.]|jgi:hypothetical protein|nr:hypothetical protein [Candidatus Angelobacter sp.]
MTEPDDKAAAAVRRLIESGPQPRSLDSENNSQRAPLPRYVKLERRPLTKTQRLWLIAIVAQFVTTLCVTGIFGERKDFLNWLTILAALNVGAWFLWTQAGRFKWFAVGIASALYASSSRSENGWLYLLGALLLILWRDEALRDRVVQKAKEETRDDFVPKPWFQIGITEEEAIFGPQKPPPISNEGEGAMQFLADRLRKKL